MMYMPIYFTNLDVIQKKVLEMFPLNKYGSNELFYIDDNLNKFLSISELSENLERLQLTESIRAIAFYNVLPTNDRGTQVHVDSGTGSYSLNLPISGCAGTYVNFYECMTPPELTYNVTGVPYYKFNYADCILSDRVEMCQPMLINIQKIHNITNQTKNQRITLLIRLHESWDYDLWASINQLNSQLCSNRS